MIVCSVNRTVLGVEHYHSSLNSTPFLADVVDSPMGLTKTKVVINDGILKCSFNKDLNTTDDYFNINRKYYLIFQNGTIENGKFFLKKLTNY